MNDIPRNPKPLFNRADDDFIALVDRYFDGSLNDEELSLFEDALRNDANKRRIFRNVCLQDQLLIQVKRPDRFDLPESPQTTEDTGFWMNLHALKDADGSVNIVDVSEEMKRRKLEQRAKESANRKSTAIFMSKSEEDADSQTRHYVIPRPLFYGSIAAVVAIAALIIWPMLQPIESHRPEITSVRFIEVATLIDQSNANWRSDSHDIAIGKPIYNENIKLTSGFARIRFNNQAEVILEAPCEFVPLGEDRMRLISGRIVGQCFTADSKGFMVLANDTQVIDLGTEFAMDVTGSRTEVHVLDGEVSAAIMDKNDKTIAKRTLKKDDAVEIDENGVIRSVIAEPRQFVRDVPRGDYVMPDYVLAYWRFESGEPGTMVPHTAQERNTSNFVDADASQYGNRLYSFIEESSPRFSQTVPARIIPQTGMINAGSLDDTAAPSTRGTRNLYSRDLFSNPSKSLESHRVREWTVEVSVNPLNLEGTQAFVAKDGRLGSQVSQFILGATDGRPFVEFIDQWEQTNRVDASRILDQGKWHHLVAVCDRRRLRLFVKTDTDDVYKEVGNIPVQGSGLEGKPGTKFEWSIGGMNRGKLDARAVFDEVRISDKALTESEFLMSWPDE